MSSGLLERAKSEILERLTQDGDVVVQNVPVSGAQSLTEWLSHWGLICGSLVVAILVACIVLGITRWQWFRNFFLPLLQTVELTRLIIAKLYVAAKDGKLRDVNGLDRGKGLLIGLATIGFCLFPAIVLHGFFGFLSTLITVALAH